MELFDDDPPSRRGKLDLELVRTLLAIVDSGRALAENMGPVPERQVRLSKLWQVHDKALTMMWNELARRRDHARKMDDYERRMKESLNPRGEVDEDADFADDDDTSGF